MAEGGKTVTIAAMPAYNEEDHIAKTIIGCRKYVDKVVVVDDGSSDATSEIAEALGAIVIKHPVNKGYGAALQTIFNTAREMDVDKMVIIDSDGQHDPGDILKLFEPLNNGADIVIGSRFVNGNGKNVPAYRKMGMKVLDKATNIAGGINVTDTQSGFRAYRRKAIENIRIKDNGMSAGSEILMQMKEHDLTFKEIEIHCNYNVEKPSKQNPISHGLKVLAYILGEIEMRKPLYYITLPGLILMFAGLVMGFNTLEMWRSGGNLPFGPTLFTMAASILGTFSVFSGLILHSVSKLLDEKTRTSN
ncbi:MAG: glycosyltransferase family 2 protein [Candidatus Methanoperedens sp.]|nr:glycosyltransferase family 2 protein [Candidatus Methanoperedens sp.]